jgi:hypothetical protein
VPCQPQQLLDEMPLAGIQALTVQSLTDWAISVAHTEHLLKSTVSECNIIQYLYTQLITIKTVVLMQYIFKPIVISLLVCSDVLQSMYMHYA